jgi:hypothetical protein
VAILTRRKGRLEELLSRAIHVDNPEIYSIIYRDYETAKEISLPEFLELSNNFETIPASRIIVLKRNGKIVYMTSRKDLVKLLFEK